MENYPNILLSTIVIFLRGTFCFLAVTDSCIQSKFWIPLLHLKTSVLCSSTFMYTGIAFKQSLFFKIVCFSKQRNLLFFGCYRLNSVEVLNTFITTKNFGSLNLFRFISSLFIFTSIAFKRSLHPFFVKIVFTTVLIKRKQTPREATMNLYYFCSTVKMKMHIQ